MPAIERENLVHFFFNFLKKRVEYTILRVAHGYGSHVSRMSGDQDRICWFWVRGVCQRNPCRFLHTRPTPNTGLGWQTEDVSRFVRQQHKGTAEGSARSRSGAAKQQRSDMPSSGRREWEGRGSEVGKGAEVNEVEVLRQGREVRQGFADQGSVDRQTRRSKHRGRAASGNWHGVVPRSSANCRDDFAGSRKERSEAVRPELVWQAAGSAPMACNEFVRPRLDRLGPKVSSVNEEQQADSKNVYGIYGQLTRGGVPSDQEKRAYQSAFFTFGEIPETAPTDSLT